MLLAVHCLEQVLPDALEDTDAQPAWIIDDPPRQDQRRNTAVTLMSAFHPLETLAAPETRPKALTSPQRVQRFMGNKALHTAEKRLIGLDTRAKALFEPYADALPMRVLDVLSKLGDQPQLRLIASSLVVIGTFADNDRLVRAGARMLIAHEAATAIKNVVKTNIDRTRPRSAEKGQAKRPQKGDHTAKEKTSFPSGHSAGAIAAARAFSREFPEYGAAAIGGAALVSASQVPRCAHYPTDVAAGVLVGLFTEGVTNFAWNVAEMDDRSVD